MKGKYEIEIYNNRVHYQFEIRRNITVIQGNSATGKTELIRLLSDYNNNGNSSGVTLICEKPCKVLTSADWQIRLRSYAGSIVFIDEGDRFVYSEEFAKQIRGSDNYFVLIGRDSFPQLPYSIEEIYGLKQERETQKYKNVKRVYNEFYPLYHAIPGKKFEAEEIITEDSNAGHEFFTRLFQKPSMAAGGKSKVLHCIKSAARGKKILAVVDGAAFGADMGAVMRYIEDNDIPCAVYAPESFEYLILKSGMIEIPDEVVKSTYEYVDSIEYMSWEEFFTAYLTERTQNSIYRYNKKQLNQIYLSEYSIRLIKGILPNEIG